jgi:exopolysaccharide biosynthesis protein
VNGSWGYTLPEVADLLKDLGVVWAINLDGGGSSTIVGKDGTVLNNPSDGTQRRVPTAIVISEQ